MSWSLSQRRIIHLSRYRGKPPGRLARINPRSAQHEILERGNKQWRITHGGHHAKSFDAQLGRFLAGFDVDFVERFDVLGDERDGRDEHLLDAFVSQPFDRLRQRGLKPLCRTDAALIAKHARLRPARKLLCAQFAHETYRLLDLLWIGVALFDQAHRQTMRAEHQMNPRTVRKLPQYRSNPLDQRLNIERMIVKIIDGTFRRFPRM